MSDEIEEEIPGKILAYIEGDGEGKIPGKIPDTEFLPELVRRLGGRMRINKGESLNVVDLAEDFGKKRAYQVIREVLSS